MVPSSNINPLDEVKAMQSFISFGVTRPSFEYGLPDDFAFTMDSMLAEIEAADPLDLRELEPGEDWDDSACTEPSEKDGEYFEEDDGL